METLNIYIDGACSNNGKKDAKAGYGVYFGENDSRNESGLVEGKQSNNTGELTAFIRCMNIIQDDQYKNTKINIYTDSEYVIKCVTTYGDKLEANGWNSKKEIPNIELVKQAYELYKNNKITLHYIKAHTANTDIHSLGNAGADKLANDAANISGCVKKQYVKLDIPFSNKEKAKTLGAKWDTGIKKWYYISNISDDQKEKLQKYIS